MRPTTLRRGRTEQHEKTPLSVQGYLLCSVLRYLPGGIPVRRVKTVIK